MSEEDVNFQILSDTFDANREKPLKEWVDIDDTTKSGKQGLVGLFKKGEQAFAYKISQELDFLPRHEHRVSKKLAECSFCPHFCRTLGILTEDINPKNRKKGNPFSGQNSRIKKEVLVMEYIDKSSKLYNYIKSEKIREDVIYSAIFQTLAAISVYQKHVNFTHYDLHSNNVMIKEYDNVIFLYVLKNTCVLVPSFGYKAIIIDYGFSYCDYDQDDCQLWQTLAHTAIGFTSERFDPIADPKLFLVTVSREMEKYKKSKKSRILRNITRNLFNTLKIDWNSGWDVSKEKSASSWIMRILQGANDESELFRDYDCFCMDLVQSLIKFPIQEQDYSDIKLSYTTFTHEFAKIEREISSMFYCLYILKGIVELAREVYCDYINPKYRKIAVNYFSSSLNELLMGTAKFCDPKQIHYERMLCSLLCLSRGIEGLLYVYMGKSITKKEKEYKRLEIKDVDDILEILQVNIPIPVNLTVDSTVRIIDSRTKTRKDVKLTKEQVEIINSTEYFKGEKLYEILNAKNTF